MPWSVRRGFGATGGLLRPGTAGGLHSRPADGEAAGFELWPLARVIECVRDSDDFKFNVNLVLIELFRRLGLASSEAALSASGGAAAIGISRAFSWSAWVLPGRGRLPKAWFWSPPP